MGNLLLNERPLVVLPSLVRRVGLDGAVILQQVQWLLEQPRNGCERDGHKWVWGDYDEWRDLYFSFWSTRTLQRHILRLEKEGFLISAQLQVQHWDRTKYYRLDYTKLEAAFGDNVAHNGNDAAPDDVRGGPGRGGGTPPGGAPSAPDAAEPKAGADGSFFGPSTMTPVSPLNTTPMTPLIVPTLAPSMMSDVAPSTMSEVARSSITTKTSTKSSSERAGKERRAESAGAGAAVADAGAPSAAAPGAAQPRLARGDFDLHPALLAYKELYGWLPNRAQQQIIINADIKDQTLWRRCLWRWAARGYNPRRLDGVLDWYRDPQLTEEKRRPTDSVTADTRLKLGGDYAPMPAPAMSASKRAQQIIDSMPVDVIALLKN